MWYDSTAHSCTKCCHFEFLTQIKALINDFVDFTETYAWFLKKMRDFFIAYFCSYEFKTAAMRAIRSSFLAKKVIQHTSAHSIKPKLHNASEDHLKNILLRAQSNEQVKLCSRNWRATNYNCSMRVVASRVSMFEAAPCSLGNCLIIVVCRKKKERFIAMMKKSARYNRQYNISHREIIFNKWLHCLNAC